jgi:hypothetical protein
MGNYNRLISGDLIPPEPLTEIGPDEWAAMEASLMAIRDKIEAQNHQDN